MDETPNKRKFDLEERTFEFAQRTREFLRLLTTNEISPDDRNQLNRCSGSVGANYIEANDSLSPKDFLMRIKICRKESKESLYWLRLTTFNTNSNHNGLREELIQEAKELNLIFGAIVRKMESKSTLK